MSEEVDDGNGRLLRYRVAQNSERLSKMEDWRKDVDRDRVEVKGELRNIDKDLTDLGAAVDGMRKVLLGFAFTIAGSAVVFALSILLATGKL